MARHRDERIAQERIDYLYDLAQKELEEHPDDSRRYIRMLRDLATKHNIMITEKKQTFCKQCNTVLVPGKTCTVRVRDDRRVLTCDNCGAVKRLGL